MLRPKSQGSHENEREHLIQEDPPPDDFYRHAAGEQQLMQQNKKYTDAEEISYSGEAKGHPPTPIYMKGNPDMSTTSTRLSAEDGVSRRCGSARWGGNYCFPNNRGRDQGMTDDDNQIHRTFFQPNGGVHYSYVIVMALFFSTIVQLSRGGLLAYEQKKMTGTVAGIHPNYAHGFNNIRGSNMHTGYYGNWGNGQAVTASANHMGGNAQYQQGASATGNNLMAPGSNMMMGGNAQDQQGAPETGNSLMATGSNMMMNAKNMIMNAKNDVVTSDNQIGMGQTEENSTSTDMNNNTLQGEGNGVDVSSQFQQQQIQQDVSSYPNTASQTSTSYGQEAGTSMNGLNNGMLPAQDQNSAGGAVPTSTGTNMVATAMSQTGSGNPMNTGGQSMPYGVTNDPAVAQEQQMMQQQFQQGSSGSNMVGGMNSMTSSTSSAMQGQGMTGSMNLAGGDSTMTSPSMTGTSMMGGSNMISNDVVSSTMTTQGTQGGMQTTSATGSTSMGAASSLGTSGSTVASLPGISGTTGTTVSTVDSNDSLPELINFKDSWDPWEPSDVPVFFHIPKSGGSTIKDVMGTCHRFVMASEAGVTDGHINDTEIAVVYPRVGVPGASLSPFVNIDATTVAGIDRAKRMGFADSGLGDAVVTPFMYEANELFTPSAKGRLFTVFRHPIDRAVSLFYYLQVADWEPTYDPALKDWDISQYATSDKIENNWLTRQLSNQLSGDLAAEHVQKALEVIRRKFLVGLMSKMEETMTRLERFFHWTYHVNPANQEICRTDLLSGGSNSNSKKKQYKPKEGDDAWNLLVAQNQYDMQLWGYIETLFDEQEQYVADTPEDMRNVGATCCKCGPPTFPPEGFECPAAIVEE